MCLLDGAVKVYEYSEYNLKFYPRGIFKPFLPNTTITNIMSYEKEHDVLFYGYMTPRRQQIINNLPYRVSILDNLTYNEMEYLIPRSNWVLSIGSHSNIHNDLLRTTVVLNLGGNIMLEPTQEQWYDEYLKENFSTRICFI